MIPIVFLYVFLFIGFVLAEVCEVPNRILFAMPPTYSHTIGAYYIAKYYKEKHPDAMIDFYWHSKYIKQFLSSDLNFKIYNNEHKIDEMINNVTSYASAGSEDNSHIGKVLMGVAKMHDMLIPDLEKAISQRKYDLIITHMASTAAVDLAEKYNTPAIILSTPIVLAYGSIGEAAFLPSIIQPIPPTETMKLTNRLKYFWKISKMAYYYWEFTKELDRIRSKYYIKKKGFNSGISDHLVLAYTTWGLEYPRRLAPMIQLIGTPFLQNAVMDPKQSKDPFIEYLNNLKEKEYGVLVSFGSFIQISQEFADKLINGLLDTDKNMHIIFVDRSNNYTTTNPRVKVRSWVDQKAILGHPKTKFIVSHCGSKGFIESVLNEKPILAIPFAGDQPLTAQRAVEKGVAILLRKNDVTRETVKQKAIEMLRSEKSMKEKIKELHQILMIEDGLVNAEKWITKTLKLKGYENLKPVVRVPFWVEYHYDVVLVVLGGMAILAFSLIMTSLLGLYVTLKLRNRNLHMKKE